MDHGDIQINCEILLVLFDFVRTNIHINGMAAKTKDWGRKPRSNSNWQHLSVSTADNGERWSIVWDTERKPGPDGRNTALEKLETGALDRARHMLRMGFIVYEIRRPSGDLYLQEADLQQRFGVQAAAR
jgi:hypothetical protein